MSPKFSSHPSTHTGASANSEISHQSRMLASTLSQHMGLDGALEISNENQWHSVVAALQEMKSKRR